MLAFALKVSKIVPPRLSLALGSIKLDLMKASMKISFGAYVGLMVFSSLVIGIGSFTISYILFSLMHFQIIHPILLPAMAYLIGGFLSMGIYLLYPKVVASSRANKIESNLPTIANFLAVLASSGMPPESIFRSLARVGPEFSIAPETKDIIRDIELLGMDLHTALKKASERAPSKRFGALLDGITATSHMGGDLAAYLRDQADNYKKMRLVKMKSFLDSLSVVAEVYVTFMVAAPLMMIVMLSVMSFIGGGVSLGGIDPRILLDLLTFVITPVTVLMLILTVDALTPQR